MPAQRSGNTAGLYKRLRAHEGTVTAPKTLAFEFVTRAIHITNDNRSVGSLRFRYRDDEDWATLKPQEHTDLLATIRELLIDVDDVLGEPVKYRIWGEG